MVLSYPKAGHGVCNPKISSPEPLALATVLILFREASNPGMRGERCVAVGFRPTSVCNR